MIKRCLRPPTKFFNPLSANPAHIRNDTVVTSDSCNSGRHSESYETILTFSCKSLKFSTKWYTKLSILVDPFLKALKELYGLRLTFVFT